MGSSAIEPSVGNHGRRVGTGGGSGDHCCADGSQKCFNCKYRQRSPCPQSPNLSGRHHGAARWSHEERGRQHEYSHCVPITSGNQPSSCHLLPCLCLPLSLLSDRREHPRLMETPLLLDVTSNT